MISPSKQRIYRMGPAILCAALASGPAMAQPQAKPREVFRLGAFDGSSYEFSQGAPHGPVQVRPEKTGSVNGWYAFQLAVDRQTAGANCDSPAARAIVFSIPGVPRPAYRVDVSLLFEHASVPVLCVVVNGHEGEFYPAPALDRRMGDGGAVSFPAYSHADLSFLVPGVFLHAGENRIAFTAVFSDEARQVPDAGFNYDAIAMSEAADTGEASPALRLQPTIFFRKGNAGLEERIDAIVRTGDAPVRKASVVIGATRAALPLQPGAAWGEQKFRLFFPAFEAPMQARIDIDAGHGLEHRQQEIAPAKRWTVFIVPHVHFDLGYTDFQAKVASVQSRIVDEALDLFAVHPEFRHRRAQKRQALRSCPVCQ